MKAVNQFRFRVLIASLISLLMFCAVLLSYSANMNKVYAETNFHKEINSDDVIENNGVASPYGIYTHLSLSINGLDGRIWATVRNDITIFPATVAVIVELYSSDTYYESHTDMDLVCMNSIEDLNMGETIVAEGYTRGVQKYWQARMRYKIDNNGWKAETTGTMLYSAEGKYIGLQ